MRGCCRFPRGLPAGPAGGLYAAGAAKNLGKRIGANNLYVKNDAVCFPTLSFKDRVVSVALANAQAFGFETVGCSSTGNLANSVAAQAARLGLKACILVPADLEPAKILNTLVYGARLVRIDGNYDHVNRLCTLIADEYNWGFVNVNLRPYYAEGSKTVGYEIAEQLGWKLPDNVVVPMAGGSLIRKIRKAFNELIALGLVEDKPVRFFGAQARAARRFRAVKQGRTTSIPQRPNTIARSLAIGNPADGPAAAKMIAGRRLGGGCFGCGDRFGDSGAGGDRGYLYGDRGRRDDCGCGATVCARAHWPDETTVVCITGNGLKTTDALAGGTTHLDARAIRPRRRLRCVSAVARRSRPNLNCRRRRTLVSIKVVLPTAFTRTPMVSSRLIRRRPTCPLLSEFDRTFPALSTQIKDENGKLRKFINIYINDEDIRFLGGDAYAFQDGDEVMLIPSIAGGRR
jgi:threonine synthase